MTSLSGRGVGMDVVKRNIEALRGSITIDSEAGRGTTVRVRLPLTLAIMDCMLVTVGSSRFAIPLGAIEECVEYEREGERGFGRLARRSAANGGAARTIPPARRNAAPRKRAGGAACRASAQAWWLMACRDNARR
ncbi:ATP-binding protein [Massilia eburnea]|uniref:ATP-binding protein n=1 Tax=Massilia eburnea TaxID=1776165 RepID=UPI003D6BB0C5